MDPVVGTTVAVGIVGAGEMGAGIAQVAAGAGHAVRLFDTQPGAAAAAIERIAADLQELVARRRLDVLVRNEVLSNLSVVPSLQELSRCGLVIEAVAEHLPTKQALMRELEGIVAPRAVLATNTSSLSVTAIAQGLQRPGRVIGWHFFPPAQRVKLVEVVRGLDTEAGVVRAMEELASRWGKTAVLAPNTPGFIVNRVARPYFSEALRLLAEDIGSAALIDRLMREAGGFAMGPFELMDLIGIDRELAVAQSIYEATHGDTRYAPHFLQEELVRAGRLGRKSGQGFHDHRPEASAPVVGSATPHGGVPRLRCSPQGGPLQPLIDRLRAAGVSIGADDHLRNRPGVILLDDVDILLTDGRTAAERAASFLSSGVVLLDLARDFATTRLVGATASHGAELSIHRLASALAPAGIELLRLADVAGLGVMRTVCCLANEAADLVSWTGTGAADVDIAMVLAMAFPVGPLAWADQLGVTRVVQVLENLQRHYGDLRYRRAPRLARAHYTQESLHT